MSFQAGDKVLVTGASGFIGSHLCNRLLDLGADIHAVSRITRQGCNEKIHWYQADLGDIAAVRKLIQQIGPDILFHLASQVTASQALEQVLPTFHANLQSTVNILTAVAEIGCKRIVLAGSLREPEVEKGEAFPSSPYAAAKWASSAYARMFHALYGVPIVIARVFMVYGPDQKDTTKLIPYVILSLLREKTPLIGSGTGLYDWIYVGDVIEGYITLATAASIEGTTIDLGSGTLVSTRGIVEQLETILKTSSKAAFGALPDRPLEPTRVANVSDTYQKIGWKPATSLEVGLRATIEWYRERLKEYF